MKFYLIFFLSFLLFILSCDNPEKENLLNQREAELNLREEKFAALEKDYENLKAMRDSIRNLPDTIGVVQIPDHLLGKYNGKMICTDSDCSEHVIGDLRNDIWEIMADGVRITNKSGRDRLYTGKMEGAELKLKSVEQPGATTLSQITLQIPDPVTGRIKGTRELKGDNCTSKFSVDLEKIKN